ncbi:hypothetical protein SYNPS1DRAFT_23517 [Syncephalis pseudoplumigaleata]|uniref:tRNA (32-2'-O)-methyltransferase regulator THADA-like C-terminal TPR repeats region domain-containing protein n=1 Tax=Syncephalis pseudoplumigaleata TaxID=1712513 RepID=A0A4P9YZD3_9FUNG|nr:hypothetical protein SYNPS1DRAFT_23517 [Syncephalis pseudoplumigaleata]|eukprot:RKP24390.1 hypothetical protein SYNPS1DRAFT_23517 [Syncephalis pseudoplumigaleata]
MMLSPLVTRVFGAKSLASDAKDTLSGVSVREFFKKYPQLEPFLLARLTEVNFANAANEEQVEMSLYPVLLVLAHLKPSLSDQEAQVQQAWTPWLEASWQAMQQPLLPAQPGATQCRPLHAALLTQNALVSPRAVWLPACVDTGVQLLQRHLLVESHHLVYPAILHEMCLFPGNLAR